MKWPAVAAAFLTLAMSMPIGQVAQQGSVTGIVLDAVSRMPVKGAAVQVVAEDVRRAVTGEDGRFSFAALPASRDLYITANKGRAQGAYGRRWIGGAGSSFRLQSGQRADTSVLLWRPASVSGVVYDERGQPLEDIGVRAQRLNGPDTVRFVSELPSGLTDDHGEYTVELPQPGRYALCVPISHATFLVGNASVVEELGERLFVNPSGPETLALRGEPVPPPTNPGTAPMTYVTTCAPSITGVRGAAEIEVALGEERRGVDIQMRLDRQLQVSGRIVQPSDAFKDVDLMLTRTEATWAVEGGPSSETDGIRFLFMSVPPGDYWLHARRSLGHSDLIMSDRRGLWAHMRLNVGSSDVRDVVVTLTPGVTISGRFICDGESAATCGQQAPDLKGVTDRFMGAATMQRDTGEFSIVGVPPGRYYLSLSERALASGWTMRSLTTGGKDLADSPLEVGIQNIQDLVIMATRTPASIAGIVRDGRGPTGDAVVAVFPRDEQLWQTARISSRAFRIVVPALNGNYRAAGLPAGEYFVAAADGPELDNWPSQTTLRALVPTATRVRVDDATGSSVDLLVRRR